jgi:hypothetical protein
LGFFFYKKIISRSPRKIELLFFLLPTLTTKSIASAQFWGFFRVCGALEGSGNLVLRAPFLLVLMVTCPMYLPSRLSGASRYPRLLPLHWLFFTFLAVYWAIAHDFSAVFSKMGVTFAQKLRLWRSFFHKKIISMPPRKNQLFFFLLPTLTPKIHSHSAVFWGFLQCAGPWKARAIRCCVLHLNLSSWLCVLRNYLLGFQVHRDIHSSCWSISCFSPFGCFSGLYP